MEYNNLAKSLNLDGGGRGKQKRPPIIFDNILFTLLTDQHPMQWALGIDRHGLIDLD